MTSPLSTSYALDNEVQISIAINEKAAAFKAFFLQLNPTNPDLVEK
jgi:hypothetical protein